MTRKSRNNRVVGLKPVAHSVAHCEDDVPYTLIKDGKCYFSKRAPVGLKPKSKIRLLDRTVTIGANGYVRFSLGTISRKLAKPMVLRYAAELDAKGTAVMPLVDQGSDASGSTERFQAPELRKFDVDDPIFQITDEEIESSASALYAYLLADDDAAYKRQLNAYFGNQPSTPTNIAGVEIPFQKIRPPRERTEKFNLPSAGVEGDAALIREQFGLFNVILFRHTGKVMRKPDARLMPMAKSFRRYINGLKSRSESIDVPTPPIPKPLNSVESPASTWSWDDALKYYADCRKVKAETIANYRIAWRSLEAATKVPLLRLELGNVVAWRDDVLSQMNPETAKNRLVQASAIWRESQVSAKIPRNVDNPFDGVSIRVSTNYQSRRQQFSEAELRKIFAAKPWSVGRSVSELASYWIPLIGLYHGARLNEVCGLETNDIEDSEVGLVIHIRPNSVRDIKRGIKGARRVPVHPELMKLGFQSYVNALRESGVARAFPCLARADTFGESFVAHVQALIKPPPERLVGMHCFRHNWETAKRNAMPNFDYSVGAYMLGRTIDRGSAAQYGSSAGLVKLRAEIEKIAYGLQHIPAPRVSASMFRAEDNSREENMSAALLRKKSRLG